MTLRRLERAPRVRERRTEIAAGAARRMARRRD